MDRLTRDLRELTRFNTTFPSVGADSGSALDFDGYTPASTTTPVRIRWYKAADAAGTTAGTTLWRREGSQPAEAILRDLANPEASNPGATPPTHALFEWTVQSGSDQVVGVLAPYRVTVTITMLLANPGATFSLSSDVQLRNIQVPQPPNA
jgi:hypothetical protein